MIDKRILVVAPYPIVKPQNGGQKRAKAILEMYRTSFIHARYVSVFHRGHYPEWDEDDLPLGDPLIIAQVDKQPYATELIAGEAIDKDIHVRSYMAKLLMEYQPHIIHIEQPFAYLGLKPLLIELGISPIIIFGSQNIEYPLKKRIFKELKVPGKIATDLVERTKALEYELSRIADLVVAVNYEDAESHKSMGAKNCIVATNGIDKVKAPKKDLQYWQDYKKQRGINHILTFVGSGHPPNWEGFLAMVGDDTKFIPPKAKIIIAGGVTDYFQNEFKSRTMNFWKGINAVGKLEEDRLAGLLESSDVILLPITTKRGSNLKTAEALLSGKKIVATSNTFHGFESYEKLPNIYIANTKEDFNTAIIEALRAKYVELSPQEMKLVQRVQWRYSLEPIIGSTEKILKRHAFRSRLIKARRLASRAKRIVTPKK